MLQYTNPAKEAPSNVAVESEKNGHVNRKCEYFTENFVFKHETCFQCNGFYAPNFGQPVCFMCHVFLHSDDISQQLNRLNFQEKMDDGDSGNEEPKDHSDLIQIRQQFARSALSHERIRLVNAGDLSEFIDIQLDPRSFAPMGAAAAEVHPIVEYTENNSPTVGTMWQMAHTGNTRNFLQEKLSSLVNVSSAEELKPVDPEVILNIPTEVWFVIFSFLDDVTLWIVSNVCTRWHQLIHNYVPDLMWKKFTTQRWPLFKSLFTVKNWKNVYTSLAESAPCLLCLRQMKFQVTPHSENSWRRNRLKNELRTLQTDPPEGISAEPLDKMALHWQASIIGPAGSPYAGGTFFLYIQIPPSYPLCPPLVRFISRIFHPNVSRHGDIGIDSIQHNWSLALTISKVLISIQSLLTDPYTKVCMEPDIGRLYEENKPLFDTIAKSWTWKHAMTDALDFIPDDCIINTKSIHKPDDIINLPV